GVQNKDQFSAVAAGVGNHVITYTYTDSSGCVSTAQKTMKVENPPTVVAGVAEGICAGSDPYQLTGASPAGGYWTGNGVDSAGVFTPLPSLTGKHTLTYTVRLGSCV